jgi:hypothetical protein
LFLKHTTGDMSKAEPITKPKKLSALADFKLFLKFLNSGQQANWAGADDPGNKTSHVTAGVKLKNIVTLIARLNSLRLEEDEAEKLLQEVNKGLRSYKFFIKLEVRKGRLFSNYWLHDWSGGVGLFDKQAIRYLARVAGKGFLQKLVKCENPRCNNFAALRGDGTKQVSVCSNKCVRPAQNAQPTNKEIARIDGRIAYWKVREPLPPRLGGDARAEKNHKRLMVALDNWKRAVRALDEAGTVKYENIADQLTARLKGERTE